MSLAFHHLAVQCMDLERQERFYREVLRLEVARRWPSAGGEDRSVWLQLGDGFLALERASEPPLPSTWRDGRSGLHLVALRIRPEERAGWERRFAELRVPVEHRTRWTIYVRDPEGNRIGLSHHPEDPVKPARTVFDRRRYRTDNYVYLLADGDDAALVDPGDPEVALALVEAHGVRPRHVLHTHGHPDHTGGTEEVARRLGAKVYGSSGDAGWYRPDVDVSGSPALVLGALRLRVHAVPGHTAGSVAYEWEGRLLTGDTLFWGGAGNCKHGGDPVRLAESFLGVLAALDGSLEVHPGHDYAEPNLPFALDLEPGNGAARAQLEAARAAHARGDEPAPSTLAQERAANPFLRAAELLPELRRRGHPCRDPREAFVVIRRLKDAWR